MHQILGFRAPGREAYRWVNTAPDLVLTFRVFIEIDNYHFVEALNHYILNQNISRVALERAVRIDMSSANFTAKSHFQMSPLWSLLTFK